MWLKNKHMKPQHLPPTSVQSHLYVNPTKFEDFEDSYGSKHLMQYVTNVFCWMKAKVSGEKEKEENS